MKKKGLFRRIFGVDRFFEPVREVKDTGKFVWKGIYSRLKDILSRDRLKAAYHAAQKPSAPPLPGYVVFGALFSGAIFIIAGIIVIWANGFKPFYLVSGSLYALFGLMPIFAVLRRLQQYRRFHKEAISHWNRIYR